MSKVQLMKNPLLTELVKNNSNHLLEQWPSIHLRRSYLKLFADFCEKEGNLMDLHQEILDYPFCPIYSGKTVLRGLDQLHSAISVIGMLMHFKMSDNGELENTRRKGKKFSTNPNHPVLSKTVAHNLAENLLIEKNPFIIRNNEEFEDLIPHLFDFKVVDPSMEAGHLILCFLDELIDILITKLAFKLTKHALRKFIVHICENCIWGIDKNPAAIPVVNLIFKTYGKVYGINELRVKNLLNEDTVDLFVTNEDLTFDCVINNPPWGEKLTQGEVQIIKSVTSSARHKIDSYIAFVEISLSKLKKGGYFTFVLPAQFLSSQNSYYLRKIIANNTRLSELVLLPREVFFDAAVRSLIISGRKEYSDNGNVSVSSFPPSPVIDKSLSPFYMEVPRGFFRSNYSWSKVFIPESYNMSLYESCFLIGDLYEVVSGCKARKDFDKDVVNRSKEVGLMTHEKNLDVIRCKDVFRYSEVKKRGFCCDDRCYKGFSKHLLRREEHRVYVRQTCKRNGDVHATLGSKHSIPIGYLYVIYTPTREEAVFLTMLLNSEFASSYFRIFSPSLLKVDFQKVNLGDIARFPLPPKIDYFEKDGFKNNQKIKELLLTYEDIFERKTESGASAAISKANQILSCLYE